MGKGAFLEQAINLGFQLVVDLLDEAGDGLFAVGFWTLAEVFELLDVRGDEGVGFVEELRDDYWEGSVVRDRSLVRVHGDEAVG